MPEHLIEVVLPKLEIKNSDAVITVSGDGTILGTLTISRGSIDYRPNGHERVVSLTWEEYDRLMRKLM